VGEEKRLRYFITNHQNQPLELHLSTGVIVLGAWEEAEVQEADLDTPQVGALQKNRLVTTRAGAEDPSASTTEAAPETKRRVKTKKEG
jgi:hypothetical protein